MITRVQVEIEKEILQDPFVKKQIVMVNENIDFVEELVDDVVIDRKAEKAKKLKKTQNKYQDSGDSECY